MQNVVKMGELIGKGYKEFWNFKGRYRVVKGGRGSKKSCDTSIWIIYNMMKYFVQYGLKPNALVIRKHYSIQKESTFAQLRWAINKLGVSHLWKVKNSPLELEFLPSGQRIIFRGLDDPDSITSITSADGQLCWVWWEEAYQIQSEEAFNKVDLSIRGDMPYPLFKQHTLTFNPWSSKSWIKRRFFDADPDPNILAITTNYLCNEFLGEDDIAIFERMKKDNPKRYSIEGLGEWGIATGQVYENYEIREFDWKALWDQYIDVKKEHRRFKLRLGLDFGYTVDPTAFVACLVDTKKLEIYIFDEYYKIKMSNKQIVNMIQYKGFGNEIIKADSAEPRTIDELKALGLRRIRGVVKGTIESGVQKLQDYKIIIHPRCENAAFEIENYVWDEDRKTGEMVNKPIDDFNHLMDALRYATDDISKATFRWNDPKVDTLTGMRVVRV